MSKRNFSRGQNRNLGFRHEFGYVANCLGETFTCSAFIRRVHEAGG